MNTIVRSCCMLPVAAIVLALPVAVKAAPVDFDLPVQPLETSLKAVATAGGLNLVASRDLLTGKAAPALKGRYEPPEALRRLLAGSGLAIATTDGNAVITRQTGEITLEPVKVADTRQAADGSAEVGYRVDTLHSVGPLGAMNVMDTPYSMTVIPHQLIENIQASSPDLIIQMNPFSQLNTPTTRGYNVTETIRGFSAMQLFDGSRESLVAYEDLEDKDRVEILNGLSGFLNGNAAASTVLPGGTINYLLKRPTDRQFTDLTIGEYYNYDPYAHVDVGGPVGEKFGYRLNALAQSGDTAVDQQSLTRYLISGAFDIHLADNLLLQFDLSNSYRKLNGIDAFWGTASGAVPFPSAPNASKNFGQPWTFWETSMLHTGTNMTWDVNDALTLRSSFRFAQRDSKDLYENNTFQNNGTFSEAVYYSAPGLSNMYEGNAFADIKASTFGIGHKITFGYSGDQTISYSPIISFQPVISTAAPLTGLSVLSPQYVFERAWTDVPRRKSSEATNESLVLADNITIDDQWSLLVGLNDARILTKSYAFSTTGALSSSYDRSDVTPSGSIIYKPLPWISTYATYMEGLEPGGGPAAPTAVGINGTLPVTNAGALLAPIVDTEYEVGAKVSVGGSLLTLALFDISRASELYVPSGASAYTYSEDGTEEHKGIELGVSGKATKNLTLWGGVTFMDAEVTKNPNTPSLVGTRPASVSDRLAKIYAEYSVDEVPGLTLTGGLIYAGNYYAFSGNADLMPAYTVANIGVRYERELYGTPTIFRLNVNNLAGSNYWISPGYEGDPRTVIGSVQVRF